MTSTSTNLGSVSHFRDVGASLNQRSNRGLLKENTLYISTTLRDVAPADLTKLRLDHCIACSINTDGFPNILLPDKENPLKRFPFYPNGVSIENVLGLVHCKVNSRDDEYYQQLKAETTAWDNCKLFYHIMLERFDKADKLMASKLRKPGMMQDILITLDCAMKPIGELFNKVFANSEAYPILLNGGSLQRDPTILLILILLFLETPLHGIEADVVQVMESIEFAQEEAELDDDLTILLRSKHELVAKIKDHIDANYGGAEGYLDRAGVTAAAKAKLKENLMKGYAERRLDIE